MKTVSFTVPGEPLGKQARATTGSGISYLPKQSKNYYALIKLCYYQANAQYLTGALKVTINAYLSIAPSMKTRWKRELMLKNVMRPTKKPDFDNVAKFLDALKTIAWHDDKDIVDAEIHKWWTANNPRVEFVIEEIYSDELLERLGLRGTDIF